MSGVLRAGGGETSRPRLAQSRITRSAGHAGLAVLVASTAVSLAAPAAAADSLILQPSSGYASTVVAAAWSITVGSGQVCSFDYGNVAFAWLQPGGTWGPAWGPVVTDHAACVARVTQTPPPVSPGQWIVKATVTNDLGQTTAQAQAPFLLAPTPTPTPTTKPTPSPTAAPQPQPTTSVKPAPSAVAPSTSSLPPPSPSPSPSPSPAAAAVTSTSGGFPSGPLLPILGAAFGGLLLGGLVMFLVFRHRRRHPGPQPPPLAPPPLPTPLT